MKSTVHRDTWPKIRAVFIRGVRFYQVDARKTGTSGKRESFSTLGEAEKRADALEKLYDTSGKEGLGFPASLRMDALTALKLLEPFPGKTLTMAAEYYRACLENAKQKEASALVATLADAWYNDKASGKHKKLREETLKGIRNTRDTLKATFSTQRILELTTDSIQAYLDKQNVGLQRQYNINNLFSQFFNWCIKHEYCTVNPCDKIEITVEEKEVSIFTPNEAEAVLRLCEARFPDYVLYHAISLFAGLRPEEAQYLEWENIHLEERTITVLAETSKVKETHNVHIEDVLYAWLMAYKPEKLKGFVTPQENFKNRSLQIHVAAGFRGTLATTTKGVLARTLHNGSKSEWPVDVLRHSYGSYWLSKHGNRAQLAENMCNSLQIIKKHYKKGSEQDAHGSVLGD